MTVDLFSQSGNLIRWIFNVVRQFFRVAWWNTYLVVTYSVIARVARMLAFLLPLKVILLAGSGRVPSYFRPFLAPDQKDEGVIVLSVAACVFYLLTLLLDARVTRLSEKGSRDLLAASGVMAVVSNQRAEAQGFYARFTQIAARVLFALAGLLCLAVLAPAPFAFLLGLFLCFFVLTAWILHGVTPLRRNRISDFIADRLGNYLNILSSIAFLSTFLVILSPFVTDSGGNILVAIVSFVLLRQVLSALTDSIKGAVSLVRQRHLIDTLVFPDHRLQSAEPKDQRTLRGVFGRQEREQVFAEELAGMLDADAKLRIEWCDPAIRGTAEFSVAAQMEGAPARHLRIQAFAPRHLRMLENEDLLFRHVDRKAVWAAPVLKRFSHGDYTCVVRDAGAGANPSADEWRALQADFLANLWCLEPPPRLVRIYSSSHRFLHERLTEEFVSRMDIAVDTDEEAEALGRFQDALPAMRDLVGKVPLRLVNPDFAREQTVARADGGYDVLEWGQWSLAPIGTALTSWLADDDRELDALLEEVRRRRPGMLDEPLTTAQLQLVRNCDRLERAILRGTMKAALQLAVQATSDLEAIKAEETESPLQMAAGQA